MKHQLKGNQNGFTLAEVLIVLAVLSVLISVTLVWTSRRTTDMETHQFFTQLHQDILYAQATAIARQETVTVRINSTAKFYRVMIGIVEQKRVSFPNHVTYNTRSTLTEVQFSPTGNVIKFGTLSFWADEKAVQLTVHIGKGRVQYEL